MKLKLHIWPNIATRTRTNLFALAVLAAIVIGSPMRSVAAASPDPVRVWNKQALDTVRLKNASDAQAARLYAMVNEAMFDAVNGIITRQDAGKSRFPGRCGDSKFLEQLFGLILVNVHSRLDVH